MITKNLNRPVPRYRPDIAPPAHGRAVTPYRFDTMARSIVEVIGAEVPELRETAAGTPRRETTVVVRLCLDWMLCRLRGVAVPESGDRLQAALAGLAGDGVDIEVVLRGVHEGFRVGMEMMFADRRTADPGRVRTDTFALLELSKLVRAGVAVAYVREYRGAAVENRVAAHTLTSALLSGNPAVPAGAGFVAERYHVLALSIPAHPDEANIELNGQIVARRKLRRVQAALAAHRGARPLALLSVDGGTLLLPDVENTVVEDLVAHLSEAAGVPLTVATIVAATAEIARLVPHAHELLDLAQRLGRAPGVYRFADLAAQYQLTRPGSTRDQLAGQLAALDDHPDLLETLRVHLGNDGQRQDTARKLHVHPNTVDYRLRRIGEVTGLDPAEPTSLWQLRSAMIVRDAQSPARSYRCGAGDGGARRPDEEVSTRSRAGRSPRS